MKKLIIPSKLNEGDTVAFISISGGRAGDEDMIPRYLLGKRRFEKIFHVKVVETPHALRGSGYLYEHPEKRAEDLMWALKNDSIKGIICNQGGDDSYRVLPYIDPKVIHDHPKVFMGFSDIATWMAVFAYAGVRAYYGPTVLTPIAQPGKLDAYTEEAIRRTLFSNEAASLLLSVSLSPEAASAAFPLYRFSEAASERSPALFKSETVFAILSFSSP